MPPMNYAISLTIFYPNIGIILSQPRHAYKIAICFYIVLIQIAVGMFMLLELSNVLALYFKPDFPRANAMYAFRQWDDEDENQHDLLLYMGYWVAGTKLIFLALLLVIVIFADARTQLYAVLVLIIAIASFYWKMYPLISKMDKNGLIRPYGYSKTLGRTIASFILVLAIVAVLSIL